MNERDNELRARGCVPLGEAVESAIRARGTRPCCERCGKPDVLWFVGDPCDHVKAEGK